MKKIRVAVLYGGRSGEHEVSLVSATNVIQNLDRALFDIIPIGIDSQGGWFIGDDILKKELNESQSLRLQRDTGRMLFTPELMGKTLQAVNPTQMLQSEVTSERPFDVVFPVIHGTFCEDGTIQGLLESANLPYVGSGVLASALCMDKDVSKRLMLNADIPIVPFVVIRRGWWEKNPALCREMIFEKLNLPFFVKPANTGSSVGVSKVKSEKELDAAIADAFKYDTKLVVEQGIDVREIEVAVLESTEYGQDPIVSIPGEINPTNGHEFYSYAAKYLDEKGAELQIPAKLSFEKQQEAQELAKNIFNILECEGMARVDLFLEKTTQKLYFNEVNTIPGFTSISMYPKLMAASGMEYSRLLTHLVELAMARHARKNKLTREFTTA